MIDLFSGAKITAQKAQSWYFGGFKDEV